MRMLCSVFATLVLIAPVFAEDGPKPEKEKPAPNPHANFRAAKALADTDKDGVISAEELAAVTDAELQKRLRSFDADGDGALQAGEMETAMKGWRPEKEKKEPKEKKPKEKKPDAADDAAGKPAETPAP